MTDIEPRSAASSQVTQDQGVPGWGWQGFTAGLQRNRVTLGAFALIVISIVMKAIVLTHSYFMQDDFEFTARALAPHLKLSYLYRIEAGHLFPGVWASVWLLARVSAYDWGLWGSIMLLLQTFAGLATLRALRTLFGNRPAILVPLAVCLFTSLTLGAMAWFAAGIISIPLQIAIPMAVSSHVRYLRNGRATHLIAAAVWVIIGLAVYVKALALPLLLFALTAAYFTEGRWRGVLLGTLRRYWRAWVTYVAIMAAEVAVYVAALHTSSVSPRPPMATSDVATFASDLITKTFVPAAVGGPWEWMNFGPATALTNPPATLKVLSWVVMLAVIGVSLWFRRRAWRAWAILLGWLAVGDILPVAAGRIQVGGSLIGLVTRYVADAVPVLAICLGLAFLPLVGERDAYRARVTGDRRAALAGAALGAFVLGSVWSLNGFIGQLHPSPVRSYVATANEALRTVPAGTVIVDQNVPADVLNPFLAGTGGFSRASAVLGPLVRKLHKDIGWSAAPRGVFWNLAIFDDQGRLHPVSIAGISSARRLACLTRERGVTIPLTLTVPPGEYTIQMAYFGDPDTKIEVGFGGHTQAMVLPRSSLINAYLPVTGGGGSVSIRKLSQGGGVCIGEITVGMLQASPVAGSVPALPLAS